MTRRYVERYTSRIHDGHSTLSSPDILRKLVDSLVAWATSPGVAVAVGEPAFRMFGFRRKEQLRLEDVKSLLIVRLDQIGDAVLTTPLIRELRRVLPGADITLVVRPHVKELFDTCPYVDEVLSFEPTLLGHLPAVQRHWRALRLAAKALWKKRIDLAIAPRFNRDMYHALFVAYFSGAAWRAAYEQPQDVANPGHDSNRLISHGFQGTQGVRHEVERNLEFLEHLGVGCSDSKLELWNSEHDLERVAEEMAARNIGAQPCVAIAPGAREGKRAWPIDHFRELASRLLERVGMPLVVVGDSSEWSLGEKLAAVDPARIFNLCGVFGLRSLTGLLDRCALFVGNDSGPMHIAAARGVPVVEISGYPATAPPHRPMSPLRFRPWGVAYRVVRPGSPVPPCTGPCRSDHAHCIRSVSVDDVVAATEALILEMGPASGLSVSTPAGNGCLG